MRIFRDNEANPENRLAKTTLIGGFHAVIAALEDSHDKPFEILLADSRQDERSQRIKQLAQRLGVPVRILSRSDLDLKSPEGLRHQANELTHLISQFVLPPQHEALPVPGPVRMPALPSA